MKVGVKFCGQCNPRFDMEALYGALCRQAGDMEFCVYREGCSADVLLMLHGCSAECAVRPRFSGPVVTVSPGEVDHWPVPEESMPAEILRALRGARKRGDGGL